MGARGSRSPASVEVEDLFELLHHGVSCSPGPFEVRSHELLPAFVYRLPGHALNGLLERSGGFEIPEQRPVVAEEQRVVMPSRAPKGVEHFRPNVLMLGPVVVDQMG